MTPVRLAVDVQGGDYGSDVIIGGVLDAIKSCSVPLQIYLCGQEDIVSRSVANHNGDHYLDQGTLIIEPCEEAIEHTDNLARAWKLKKGSSTVRAISLQQEEKVDCSLSAGDTRIIVSSSIFLLGKSNGVIRPALAAFLPTIAKKPVLVLDVGANLNCKVDHLVGFGLIAVEYMRLFTQTSSPSVRVLNVGQETTKGIKTVTETGKILSRLYPQYMGYIEGSRVLSGDADIIICDGFVGNVLLKSCESFYFLMESVLVADKSLLNSLKQRITILNSESYGAVPLIGIKGVVFKAHGASSARAISHAVLAAVKAVQQKTFLLNISF